jgi:cation diffusion facilitator CzcD-associated flavoprotein CzcO
LLPPGLTSAAGEETFDVLVTATGVLRVPRYPAIPGRETFAGPAFHSSRWDHSVSLQDKRIGVIGTGSTGVQITAELGGRVRQLKVFQRTAQWICPTPNLRYSALTRAALRRWPKLNDLSYRFWELYVRHFFGRAPIRPGFQRSLVTSMSRWNLRLSVRDPQLRAKLTPKDQPMCKRLIFAGHSVAYRSVAVPGFPNLFMLMGPHSPIGNQSCAPPLRPKQPRRNTTRA